MNHSFILSCESTADLPYEYLKARGVPVIFYTYSVNGTEYEDNMGRDPQATSQFYRFLQEGKHPITSQLNEFQYEQYFEGLLAQGDVLHIALGSGMTGSVFNAEKAARSLKPKYPDRKLRIVDSFCSSSGYGLLVDMAADMRDQGKTLIEVEQWVKENRKSIHHQFFTTDLKYLRQSGRVSGSAAMLGAVLNICPLMHLDDQGCIIAYDKVRGKKNAIARILETMEVHAPCGRDYSGKCFIAHTNSLDEAEHLKNLICDRFHHLNGEIRICDIGPIIASHCGPGIVAILFVGDERLPYPPHQ